MLLLYCKVHVSFITSILEDEHALSLGMLMHVKCIHELCIIILIFQSYLHHIRVISLFYMDFGDNSQFPHLFGTNPTEPENNFSHVFDFQGPKRGPNDLRFYGPQYLEGRRRTGEGSAKKKVRGGNWVGPCGPCSRPRGAPPFPPRGSDGVDLCPPGFLLT